MNWLSFKIVQEIWPNLRCYQHLDIPQKTINRDSRIKISLSEGQNDHRDSHCLVSAQPWETFG